MVRFDLVVRRDVGGRQVSSRDLNHDLLLLAHQRLQPGVDTVEDGCPRFDGGQGRETVKLGPTLISLVGWESSRNRVPIQSIRMTKTVTSWHGDDVMAA